MRALEKKKNEEQKRKRRRAAHITLVNVCVAARRRGKRRPAHGPAFGGVLVASGIKKGEEEI